MSGGPLDRALRAAGFRGTVEHEAPLAPLTTWRIGGPAEWLARPVDRDDLALALRIAARCGVSWRILGNGSNLLVSDEGVRGLVLHLSRVLDGVSWEGERVRAGAGARFPLVAKHAAQRGLAGIEFGAGIPGTIGGALAMNAGWHAFEIGNVVERVEILEPDGSFGFRDRAACGFRYRGSALKDRAVVIVEGVLRLTRDDPEEVRSRMDGYAASRRASQPTELRSCGSVFLKPPGDFAGRLIDEAGLKGLRVGDVQVSEKHANFFVNLGHATAADVLALVERVESEIERRFGVALVREFELW